jgi:hypothetical protein
MSSGGHSDAASIESVGRGNQTKVRCRSFFALTGFTIIRADPPMMYEKNEKLEEKNSC